MLFLLASVAIVTITFTVLSVIGEDKRTTEVEGSRGGEQADRSAKSTTPVMSMQTIPVSKENKKINLTSKLSSSKSEEKSKSNSLNAMGRR